MADQQPRWLSVAEQQTWLGLIAVVELLPGALDSQLQRDAGISHFNIWPWQCCPKHLNAPFE